MLQSADFRDVCHRLDQARASRLNNDHAEAVSKVEHFARLAERFGAEPGWTDTPDYIRDPGNFAFRVMGRWFMKREDGSVDSLD
jgi:hypothetical protein